MHVTSQAIKSSSLSCLVFTLTLNNTLSRSTSIWSSRNSAISNVSLMAAPGSTWAHCIHLHPGSKELSLLFVFTSETWIYAPDKLRICFLFLLLSPKRDFITYSRVLKIYLKITHTNQNEKTTQFTSFWSLFGSPTISWKDFFIFCAREVSLFLGIICTFFPPSTFSTWNCKFFSQGVHFVCWSQKTPLFPVQTLFLTQCNELLVV